MNTPAISRDDAAERLAALLFTDIVDSTAIHDRIGDLDAARLWAEHDRSARTLIRAWRGREIGRSDGFLLLFDRCDDALGFALAYQRMTGTLEVPLTARVGFHWGSVVLRENDPADIAAGATPFEVDGLCLPTAARIMAAARGGQTLLSAEAVAALPAAADLDVRRCSHGHWRLKGLEEPIELFEFAAPDVAPIPPEDSAKAHRVVRRDGLWVPVHELPHNLHPERDRFIGREDALHAIAAAFGGPARLVTVHGIGGMGKTRLAQRYARSWLGRHPGGAWFCDLSAARGVDGIAHAVAHALDVPLGSADPVQRLGVVLAGRGDCLVILDNFEQVTRHARATLGVWLDAAPAARFLVTSREVLGLAGEHVQGLAPLTSPEAQVLFRQHIEAAGLSEPLTSGDQAALPELVELLDGLPLAIELAAARARTVAPADQVRRMGERFRLLAGRSGRLDRQATLRATLDWSWDLLTPFEQSALAQLSVFERGFTLEAAEAVLAFDAPDAPWTADLIQSLIEKSLVRRVNAQRFDLLRTVQDYAARRAVTLGIDAARRHWLHFSRIGPPEATADGGADLDNIVAACRRAAAASEDPAEQPETSACAVDALTNAWAVLRLSGPFRPALDLAERLAPRARLRPAKRAQAYRVLGSANTLLGQVERADESYTLALSLAHDAGQRILEAQVQCLLADLDTRRGRYVAAERGLIAALDWASGDAETTVMTLNALGSLALTRSRLAEARQHFDRALALADTLDDRRWVGGLHGNLGTVAILEGRHEAARPHLEQALTIADLLHDRQWAGNARCNLGLLLHELGDHDRARTELETALQSARSMGHRRLEAMTLCNLGLAVDALGDRRRARARFEQAVGVARSLGDLRLEGRFLGYLAANLGESGEQVEATVTFDAAETLLSAQDDLSGQAMLASQRAIYAAQALDRSTALSALHRAEKLMNDLADAADHELRSALDTAQRIINPQR